jgi:RNA polymerase sigma-70 factor (ECF subfamily)
VTQPASESDIRRIYDTTIDRLYAWVARRCDGDRDLAEDITQETWLRAVRHWAAHGLPDAPQAWLTTVARNLLANHFRRRPAELLSDDFAADDSNGDVTASRDSLLARALSRLSLSHRRLLQAFHFDRRPVAVIAAQHGLSERAVEGRLRRARQQLRHHIESDPDSEGDAP